MQRRNFLKSIGVSLFVLPFTTLFFKKEQLCGGEIDYKLENVHDRHKSTFNCNVSNANDDIITKEAIRKAMERAYELQEERKFDYSQLYMSKETYEELKRRCSEKSDEYNVFSEPKIDICVSEALGDDIYDIGWSRIKMNIEKEI